MCSWCFLHVDLHIYFLLTLFKLYKRDRTALIPFLPCCLFLFHLDSLGLSLSVHIVLYILIIYISYIFIFLFSYISSVILWWLCSLRHFVSKFTPPIIFFLHRIGQNMYWYLVFITNVSEERRCEFLYHVLICGSVWWQLFYLWTFILDICSF